MDSRFLYGRRRFGDYPFGGYHPAKDRHPSASEVNVQIFIDRFIDQVIPGEQQEIIRMGMGKFIEKALADSGKTAAEDLTPAELQPSLANALEVSKEQQAAFDQTVEDYVEAVSTGNTNELDAATARNLFAKGLRELTIYGYKSSEYIGEEVLAYLSIPGTYVACGTTEELTGGKAWSL